MAETQEVEEETQEAAEEVTEIVEEDEGPSIEDQARAMGWKDRDEFFGPPENWSSAEKFIKVGEGALPILRQNVRHMGEKIIALESRAKDREDYFNMEVAAMKNRHKAELEKERAKAVEDGDVDKFNATQSQIDELNTAPPVATAAPAAPEYTQFLVDNPWYGTDGEMTRYAYGESEYDVKTHPELTLKQNLERTLNKVKARFPPERFGEQPVKTQRRAPQVEAGRRAVVKKNSKTYGNMPAESQAACDRAVHIGLCRSREAFVKNYYDSIGAE